MPGHDPVGRGNRLRHTQVSEVVVFGRTPAKLQAFADEFGCATTTDLSSIYDDPAVDLVDVCLPTPLHAEHVTRALGAGKYVLCELPLATTMADARRIADAATASDRQVFVDMFGRFDPANQFLHAAIAQGSYGTLKTLSMELRTALLWEGYQIGLESIAMDVLHSSLDTIVRAVRRLGAAAQALWDGWRLPGGVHRRRHRERLDRRLGRPPDHRPDRGHRPGPARGRPARG